MDENSQIHTLAEKLLAGRLSQQQFLVELTKQHTATTAEANVDLDRLQRAGYPEVIFAEGKPVEAFLQIIDRLLQAKQSVLATRVNSQQAEAVESQFPQLIYNPVARTIRSSVEGITSGTVAVITAGTSDLPVAEEAIETLRWMNTDVIDVRDVGVAGPHRLPSHVHKFNDADAVVVVAGMEGALPSVVGGYLAVPVIAVPTSVGYGANLGGIAALLGMLNSCAANVAVVNIDGGFKGAYLAGMIAQAKR